jgi:histone H2A
MASAKKRTATKKSTGKGKASTVFPSGRIGSLLRKGRFSKRVSKSAGFYAAGVISYLARELLEVVAKGSKKNARISPRALTLAVRADDELGSLLKDVTISRGGVPASANAALEKKKKAKKGKKSSGKKSSAKKAGKKTSKK